MPNNPLQVVLNANDYQHIPARTVGGAVKDFFQGRDDEFVAHQERLLTDLDQIGRAMLRGGRAAVTYMHVTLNEEAWAKTKRPTTKVLPPSKVPLVGGTNLGDMIVELTPENLEAIRGSISAAEKDVAMVPDKETNELKPKPSRARGEVGAIRALRAHHAADRRTFSAQEAIKWLADPRTGGMYLVETFVDPRPNDSNEIRRLRQRAVEAFAQLKQGLTQLSLPLEVEDTQDRWQSVRLLLLRLSSNQQADHEALLRYLDEHPIVRRVSLPPILAVEHSVPGPTGAVAPVTAPQAAGAYPVLGIIDTGVAAVSALEPWCIGRTDLVPGTVQDRSHGTFIAGLSAAAQALNPHPVFGEVPCKFFDLGLHPTQADVYDDVYPRGFIDFLEQLDAELPAAILAGARIFNMSLSIERQVSDAGYSDYATILDEIADKHDVIFVLPAGNLEAAIWRPAWPNDPADVAQMLAGYRHAGQDRLFQPAESVRAISVGAVDPPDANGHMRPTVYTRRGPSTALGLKPDVAHVGGQGGRTPNLFSLTATGQLTSGSGTSYAAPIAAKTLAALNHLIEGDLQRETLIGLLIHHATLPSPVGHAHVSKFAADFVGHGLPAHALDMLVTDDHSITLAFIGTLQGSHELAFPFTWPASLVSAKGACRGRARLTLAYRTPTHRQFGAEYVRVNMDAYLRQEQIDTTTGEVSWKGRLKSEGKIYERHLIEHGHKWWPIKRYEQVMPKGQGNSSQWRLVVDSLCRTDVEFPVEGIPFAAILSLDDPRGEAPVFDELRQTLRNSGAKIADIRTAQRVVPRA
ncbi:S8 family serine peptidase [Dyella sp. Tek66A03]|uniref:S8 family serine peptidase n=1 Tax=Dyella sp. Tek66A03 TaxID=3458298 RepID=UPI00403E927C